MHIPACETQALELVRLSLIHIWLVLRSPLPPVLRPALYGDTGRE